MGAAVLNHHLELTVHKIRATITLVALLELTDHQPAFQLGYPKRKLQSPFPFGFTFALQSRPLPGSRRARNENDDGSKRWIALSDSKGSHWHRGQGQGQANSASLSAPASQKKPRRFRVPRVGESQAGRPSVGRSCKARARREGREVPGGAAGARMKSFPSLEVLQDYLAFYRANWAEGKLRLCNEAPLKRRAGRLRVAPAGAWEAGAIAESCWRTRGQREASAVLRQLIQALGYLELLCVNLFLSPWRREIKSLKVAGGKEAGSPWGRKEVPGGFGPWHVRMGCGVWGFAPGSRGRGG